MKASATGSSASPFLRIFGTSIIAVLSAGVLAVGCAQSGGGGNEGTGGDTGGGSYRGLQSVFRPVPALSPYRTPVRGLFLASSATFPGGAVHGVPGDAAARAAMRSLRRR